MIPNVEVTLNQCELDFRMKLSTIDGAIRYK